MKKTAKVEGYKFLFYYGEGLAVFEDLNNPGKKELWGANKNHASFGFRWNNTDWEFIRDYSESPKNEYGAYYQYRKNYFTS